MDSIGASLLGGRLWGWAERAYDRAAPWLLGVMVITLSVVSVQVWWTPLVVSVACVSGVAAWMARRRRWPIFAAAAISVLSLGLWPAALVAAYYAGTTLRRRRELLLFGVATLAVVIPAYTVVARFGVDQIGCGQSCHGTNPAMDGLANKGSVLLFIGMGLVVGLWVRARREVLVGLRERAARLEREQVVEAERARAQERERIAREMHDVVAHRVSLMVLHAGALEVNAPDEATARAADLIRGTGREALENLRDVLGVLRSPEGGVLLGPQAGVGDLGRLLDQSRAAGVVVGSRVVGGVRSLPLMVESTAFRVVQEALTNVHKHAGGAPTEVVLTYRPDDLEITVRNAPPGGAAGEASGTAPASNLPASGFGLVGLRERVVLLGGEFRAGADPDGGFTVTARLPAEHRDVPPELAAQPHGQEPPRVPAGNAADQTATKPAEETTGDAP
ncbi:sensor histidine kinase [Actinopolymorpha pittospori]